MKFLLSVTVALAVASPLAAQQRRAPDPRSMGGGDCRDNVYNCADTPNPLPPPDTVWIEEMTWMDVRDAIAAGKTTAIVPTGGVEPNGPWLALGKHNYVLRATCDAIARRLGDAVCTPIIKLVPEGAIEPPSGHMRSPGTISLPCGDIRSGVDGRGAQPEDARLPPHHLHRRQRGQPAGAARGGRDAEHPLGRRPGGGARAGSTTTMPAPRATWRLAAWDASEADGLHDDPIVTLIMFFADPRSVRYDARVAAGLATINGVSFADRVQTLEWARELVEFRARQTAGAIRSTMANRGTLPPPPPRASAAGGGARPPRPAPDPRTMGGGDCRANAYNCSDTPNPLPAADTVWLEEMTWMEVRDALAAGTTTAIVPTGGIEPNGPWLVTGKHNYVLRANCDAIARKLGNAVCAPVIELVPEGQIEPASGHMRSPGTLSLRQETFEAMLTDVAHSLKMHGFTDIVFIGDSGGNQRGQDNVAAALSTRWAGEATVLHVPEYYRAVGRTGRPARFGCHARGHAGRRPARQPRHHAQHDARRSTIGTVGRTGGHAPGVHRRGLDRRSGPLARTRPGGRRRPRHTNRRHHPVPHCRALTIVRRAHGRRRLARRAAGRRGAEQPMTFPTADGT